MQRFFRGRRTGEDPGLETELPDELLDDDLGVDDANVEPDESDVPAAPYDFESETTEEPSASEHRTRMGTAKFIGHVVAEVILELPHGQ